MRWCWAWASRCSSPCSPGRSRPALFRLLGGQGAALANAEIYSHVLFTGSIAVWANFFLAALLRGGGDAATPGRYMLISSLAAGAAVAACWRWASATGRASAWPVRPRLAA